MVGLMGAGLRSSLDRRTGGAAGGGPGSSCLDEGCSEGETREESRRSASTLDWLLTRACLPAENIDGCLLAVTTDDERTTRTAEESIDVGLQRVSRVTTVTLV